MQQRLFLLPLLMCAFTWAQTQIDLPVTFDVAGVNYTVTDFGDNVTTLASDPTGGSNMVAMSVKPTSAPVWAGTTIGTPAGFANAIPFSPTTTQMTLRIYAPAAGLPIRLKAEDANNPTISVETEATTTMANAWETLTFDFNNPAMGTAAINFANTYKKLSVFFNFGTDGATAGALTFYWDDVMMAAGSGSAQINLPVTFDMAGVDYTLTDFGGNSTTLGADPTGGSNMVGISVKTAGAASWAGTTIGTPAGFAAAIPFSATQKQMSVRVYAPAAGMVVRLKAEDAANPAISVETDATTTVANAWETLTFDFANPVPNTPALNLANTYKKASIFFNFGVDGATAGALTFHWDDVMMVTPVGPAQLDLPVTFDMAGVDYTLTDFGGNSTTLGTDPAGGSNMVGISVKGTGAASWAGTTVGTPAGFATAIPFSATQKKMSVRVYAPATGMVVRLKVEDATNPAISVETDATTTVANAWETLTFDFANPVPNTPALDLVNTYKKASIFFNFGVDGATAGALTFFWDDVMMAAGPVLTQINLPVTFDVAGVDYTLTDFGGNNTNIGADPAGGSNMVGISTKTAGAASWAGTTMGTPSGFSAPIPFTATAQQMTMRVYAPAVGMVVRLKAEAVNNPTISVETDATTTVANGWETLSFNFANQAAGTAAINLANTYQKLSAFFNFGVDGATAGALTFYWDDVMMKTNVGIDADAAAAVSYRYDAATQALELSSDLDMAHVQVLALTGQPVAQRAAPARNHRIELGHLPAGLYAVRCLVNGQPQAFSILKH